MPTARLFNPGSLAYVEDLERQYKANPEAVSPEWQAYFLGLEAGGSVGGGTNPKALGVHRLIRAWRMRGHLAAWINPLQSKSPAAFAELTMQYYGLDDADLKASFPTDGLLPKEEASLQEIVDALHRIYGWKTGIETAPISNLEERRWVRQWWEDPVSHAPLDKATKTKLYEGLARANAFERLLHVKFVGAKRFSVEGNDGLIPLLLRLVEQAASDGARHMVLGMAHRGRLNALCNIFHKPYKEMFAAFADKVTSEGGPSSGDVKYHMGKVYDHHAENGANIELELMFNPSHLEAVNPLVLGAARAKAASYGKETGKADFGKVLPILVHGDSAVAGQGIVAECNNTMTLEPYKVGGTIHLIVNNQVGFTADPTDAVSGDYCTDIFKSMGVPIVHVNADCIESCWRAVKFAWAYRSKYGKDAIVDLVGYRRWGHNEGDDPTFTQPVLYSVISSHPTPAAVYRAELVAQDSGFGAVCDGIDKDISAELEAAYAEAVKGVTIKAKSLKDGGKAPATGITKAMLAKIADAWGDTPEGFTANAKVGKVVEERIAMLKGQKDLNWGAAETAAYGSLLAEGTTIRLTGQDAQRGTFSHRHAVLTGTDGRKWAPLFALATNGARHSVHNSSLSENAIMGFEYGYNHASPETLVLWEAQFGDFANGAQIVADQFLSSAEAKWGQRNGLGLLLPHGYEGQGPEHSSARLERWLQLCAEDSMRVCVPSTPAQIFHLLRRQALWDVKRPLVVMTPKSLLRNPAAVSPVDELVNGSFQAVIDDTDAPAKPKRVVLCSGKVYYDLAARRAETKADHVALVRVEELYPWPVEQLSKILGKYKCKDVWWVQEEPRNMGAWWFVQENWNNEWGYLHYAGRPNSASPAVGTTSRHVIEQKAILDAVLGEVDDKKKVA